MTAVESPESSARLSPPAPAYRYAAGVFALALVYAATGQLGLSVATVERNATLFWPPTGIAVAILFRCGLRYWPGVYLGALAANTLEASPFIAAGVAVGNTLAPVVAVLLLRWRRFDPQFRTPKDLFLLLFVGGLGGMTVSATNGVAWMYFGGVIPSGRAAEAWLTWWLGDATGVIAFAPPVLSAFVTGWRVPRRVLAREGAALLVMALLSRWAAFSAAVPPDWRASLVFLPFFMLVWVGLNLRLPAASVHVLVLSVFAVWGAANGTGLFGQHPAAVKFVMVWAALASSALVALLLSTLLGQRDRAAAAQTAADDYHTMLHDTPAMMCRYTADGTITFANESLCRFLGMRRDELVGRSVLEFLTDLPRLDAVSELQAVVGATQPLSHLGPYRRADGAERWHRWLARTVLGPDGSVREFHAVGVDITERRRADEDRRALERKMLDAQRLESLGVLAGGVSHEFNNLFAGILGHAELAYAAAPHDSPMRAHLDVILGGVKEASGLTRQLLAYSGKGKFVVRPVYIDDLVRRIVPLLQVSVPRPAELHVTRNDNLPPVVADEAQLLQQVVVNLVTNAAEALGDKAGTVTVAVTARDVSEYETPASYMFDPLPSGHYVLLRVTDNGCGMNEETQARLFDPFFSTKFAGRGLGMPAVLGIVRPHRGGIRVLSSPGGGTTVTVYLPAARVEADTPTLTGDATHAAADPPSDGGVVLVVDDEESVRHVARLMLEQLGFAVVTAADGVEALEVFRRDPSAIRAILLDLTMPRMDGAEVLAAVRANDSRVPVVLCSGFTEDAIPEHLTQAGITGFLQKPFSLTDLARQIHRAVGV